MEKGRKELGKMYVRKVARKQGKVYAKKQQQRMQWSLLDSMQEKQRGLKHERIVGTSNELGKKYTRVPKNL